MIKRTLFFANSVYLSTANKQLVVKYADTDRGLRTVPIEDVGLIILEHQQITISNALFAHLINNNVAIVNCNAQHTPIGYTMPLNGHSEQGERFKHQFSASLPLKKNLWQQTIKAKILNQAIVLESRNISADNMRRWSSEVQSGDASNLEARAAAYYWSKIFSIPNFVRGRTHAPPNNLLNYAYAILRALCARALVGSGLLPIIGIHHQNKYNAYPLADDIMEPYRPFVDILVAEIIDEGLDIVELTTELKQRLLGLVTFDVLIDAKHSPLMVAMSRSTSTLYKCFSGELRKISYPLVLR